MLKLNYAVVLGSVILVTTQFTSSIASGPSGYTSSPSYGGYNQQVQQQQQQQQNYPQQQQPDQWYSEASYQKESTTSQEDPAAVTATSEPTAGEEEDSLPPLPEGWTEHLDPNSGQYYYFNAADGTTSWDRPSSPEDVEQDIAVEGENKVEDPRASMSGETSPKYEQFSGNTGNNNFNENSTPEQQQQQAHDDLTGGISNVITKTGGPGEMIGSSSSEAERWQPNQSPDLKQPEPEESSGPPQQQQENNWESQRQTDYPMTTSGWGSSPSIQKQDQSNSTASLVDEGERQPEQIKQYQGQPTHINQQQQQQERPGGWGLPRKDEIPSSQSEPWGVTKSTEQRPPQEQSQQQSPPQPIRETPPPSNNISPDQSSSQGKWGIPKAAAITQPPPGSEQRQSWQQPPQQHNTQGNYQPPDSDQRPPPRPVQQGPPQQNRPQQQHHQPTQPPYLQRQQQHQPPPGQYNPNVSPGPGQYNQQYGGPNNYGRGYPTQQPHPSQQTSTGQVVSQGVEQGTTAVKEALSSTWKGLLGFGAKTREVAGTAREQVVTGAASAGQTLGAKSSSKSPVDMIDQSLYVTVCHSNARLFSLSLFLYAYCVFIISYKAFWETAKNTVGSVFESSNDPPGSQPGYSLSGHPQQPQPGNNMPPPGYPGRPTESGGRGPPPGYGRGPPPRNNAGPPQQPNRYGPPFGGSPGAGGPPGRQQPPPSPNNPSQQQIKPQGYPAAPAGMQPRRDPAYPQMPGGQQRRPMQTQYGGPAGSQPPNQQQQQQIPPGSGQRRPPYPGPQSNRGPMGQQGPPQPQQKQQAPPQQKPQPDPWYHPGLMGDQ
jgi:hypothetical protein